MKTDKFIKLKRLGKIGESFFYDRHNELVINQLVMYTSISTWDIEGSDLSAERLRWEPIVFDSELKEATEGVTPYLQYGGVEVKSIGSDQYLPRYGINDLSCGTLGFPIWGTTEDLDNDWTGYTREAFGNLWRWMNPSVKNRGSRPMVLAHLLKCKDADYTNSKETERFFAAVVFEDVDALISRIVDYAKPYGLDLNDWDSIPIGDEAKGFCVDGLFLQGNMLHVPLSEIEDLATVTLIGDDPEIILTGRCSEETQQARLDYLKTKANGRWIPQEKPDTGVLTDEEILRTWHQTLFLGHGSIPGLLDNEGKLIEP